jgi:hypothetical protein
VKTQPGVARTQFLIPYPANLAMMIREQAYGIPDIS